MSRWPRPGSTIAGARREGRGASSLEDQDAFLAAADAALGRDPARTNRAGLTLGTFIDALDAPGAGRDAVRMRLQGTNAVDLGQVALRVVDGPGRVRRAGRRRIGG